VYGSSGSGIGVNGAFAKYVAGPGRLLHRLPDNVPFDTAAAMEPTAVCVTSLIERCGLTAGETVVITGPGPIGLICLGIAKAAGVRAAGVIGTSRDAGIRFQKARELGGAFVLDADEADPLPKVREMTSGIGVDMVIETSGGASAIAGAFEMARRCGRICAIGISGRQEVAVPYDRGIFKALRYDFCFSSSWTSWERALALVSSGLLPLEKIITHRLPLSQWKEAFGLIERLEALKVVLLPGA
jgi:threonine dehydrogenase-like Zn-dependent dehydrogenase